MSYVVSPLGALVPPSFGPSLGPALGPSPSQGPTPAPAGPTPALVRSSLQIPQRAPVRSALPVPAAPSARVDYIMPAFPAPPPSMTARDVSAWIGYVFALQGREQKIRSIIERIRKDLLVCGKKGTDLSRDLQKLKVELAGAQAALRLLRATGNVSSGDRRLRDRARDIAILSAKAAALSKVLGKNLASHKSIGAAFKLFRASLEKNKQAMAQARGIVQSLGAAASLPPAPSPAQQQQDAALVVVEQQTAVETAQQTQEVVTAVQETAAAVQEAVATDPSAAQSAPQASADLQAAVGDATTVASSAAVVVEAAPGSEAPVSTPVVPDAVPPATAAAAADAVAAVSSAAAAVDAAAAVAAGEDVAKTAQEALNEAVGAKQGSMLPLLAAAGLVGYLLLRGKGE